MDEAWVQIVVAVIGAIFGGLTLKFVYKRIKKRSSSSLKVNKPIKQNYFGHHGKNEVNISGTHEENKNETRQ